ncbi:MAG: hypothetical protein ACT4O5_14825 [Gammaproteobacteria bacterium]
MDFKKLGQRVREWPFIVAIGVLVGLVTGGTMWMSERKDPTIGSLVGSFVKGTETTALAPERLEGFAPAELGGLPRSSLTSDRDSAFGVQVAELHAAYGDGERQLRLGIVDTGSVSGLMAIADWADIEEERRMPNGYDRTTTEGGRIVHRKWDETRKRGEYAVILGQRFVVEVRGNADSMKDLEATAWSLDLDALEALKSEGVKN